MNKRTVNNQFQICDSCGTKTRNWNIHHKNCDHFDNRKDNLAWLCVDCHKREHSTRYDEMMQTWDEDGASRIHHVDAYDILTNPSHIGDRLTYGFNMMSDNYNS